MQGEPCNLGPHSLCQSSGSRSRLACGNRQLTARDGEGVFDGLKSGFKDGHGGMRISLGGTIGLNLERF